MRIVEPLCGGIRLLDEDGCLVSLQPDFLNAQEAAMAFMQLCQEIPWRNHPVRMFGRTLPSPRLSCWIGDPDARYRYAGHTHEPLPWTALLTNWRRRLSEQYGARFNSVLLNLYRDGRDRMGWHADDEPELGTEPLIASISLGASRTFRMRRKDRTGGDRLDIELPPGSLLWMAGRTQHVWQHALPARRLLRAARINLTWRTVFAPPRHKPTVADPS